MTALMTSLMTSAAAAAGLSEIKTVYLLQMANGLDQLLAVQLNSTAILQVVTDPAKADAIFTDRIGQGFEEKLNALYGAKADPKSEADEKTFARVGAGLRSHSTAFLVDRKSREVLWSTYAPSRNHSSEAMNHTASRIADGLQKAIKALPAVP